MAIQNRAAATPWQAFYGPNLGYIQELYEQYRIDPDSVDSEYRRLFESWGAPVVSESVESAPVDRQHEGTTVGVNDIHKALAAQKLADRIRTYGHLAAKTDPFHQQEKEIPTLQPSEFGLRSEDLKTLPADVVCPGVSGLNDALEGIEHLYKTYTGSLAYEFSHVHSVDEREWLTSVVETGALQQPLSSAKKVDVLRLLTKVEGFESFLHRTFVGQKRFSLEGTDMIVPLMDHIIRCGVEDTVRQVMIGMAHRGRLNVLTHILGKSYEAIFSEFYRAMNKEDVPSATSLGQNVGWTGDVKYHLGAERELEHGHSVTARLTLAHNPSHLEFVNAVVEGYTRVAQEDRSTPGYAQPDTSRAMAILIHGDAAFPGEGVVTETLNLSHLRGYQTGGTIHIIANNRIGFTTESSDARSTHYASDIAKGYEIPIVHVNADDPEACLAAATLAYAYRARFGKDFLIDLIGYRRYGHNEMDDPSVTHYQLYEQIKKHPTVRNIYAKRLLDEGVINEEQVRKMEKEVQDSLQRAYQAIKDNSLDIAAQAAIKDDALTEQIDSIQTSVALDTLREINRNLLHWPEDFHIYPKLEKILKRRQQALAEEGAVDWGLAETLAFATILQDGTAIRLTGQDSERGTFAHRHLVLHDRETGSTYCPLHTLPHAKASFSIYNSPLSEASVLGFEYGYDVFATDTLVIWEAQYGDFANVAQVIIDQFIAAGKAKWRQKSGLVMLLPHGYEGQGPEHSSARLERFLQLSAENNWFVVNATTAAQYFHVLRRQAALIQTDAARPLVIMTPKGLIRNKRAFSSPEDFSSGRFQKILVPALDREAEEKVERLIMCSGKIATELEARWEEGSAEERKAVRILRVEQLYPFPEQEIGQMIQRLKGLREVIWVQEEPQNMGAWTYMQPRLSALLPEQVSLSYSGRPERSSPAEGLPDLHFVEQKRILNEAFKLKHSLIH